MADANLVCSRDRKLHHGVCADVSGHLFSLSNKVRKKKTFFSSNFVCGVFVVGAQRL